MKRRNFLVGLGSVSVAGAAVVGTGAFSRVEAQRSVTINVAEDPNAYLGLDSCDTPNGSYVDFENGHLEVRMNDENEEYDPNEPGFGAGINSNSTSWFHNVFQICNQGKQSACVWISDHENWPEIGSDVAGEWDDVNEGDRRVDFYVGSDSEESIVGEDNRIVLEVGECQCIGLLTRSYGLSEGDEVMNSLENEIIINADVNCFEVPGCVDEEVIYLTNSRPKDDQGDEIDPAIHLLEVTDLSGGIAELDLLAEYNNEDFDQIDSMACSPDGETLYLYDKDTGHLGTVDPSTPGAGISDLGEVDNDPGNVVLGAFSPDDVLYAASESTNSIYEIDLNQSPPEAIEIGDTGVNLGGSDIVFDTNTMFIHSNQTDDLYEVDRNTGEATTVCHLDEDLTGLAIRAGGTGNILGSVSGYPGGISPGEIIEFDRTSCGIATTWEMQLNGEDYDYESGDMATGPRCVPIN